MKDLITSEQANTAQRLKIASDGKEEYYLLVLSVYSNEYRFRKHKFNQDAAKLFNDGKFNAQSSSEELAKFLSNTITGWHLPQEEGEYSKENAVKLLLKYPQICDAVDVFSTNNENFLKKN